MRLSRSHARVAACAVLAACVVLSAPPARAADGAAAPAAIDAKYEEAQALYRGGDYAAALPAYEAVLAIADVPEAVYGVARCHHQLGHWAAAAEAYARFLAAAPAHVGAPRARGYLIEVLGKCGDAELAAAHFTAARDTFRRALEEHAAAGGTPTDAIGAPLTKGLAAAWTGLAAPTSAAAPGAGGVGGASSTASRTHPRTGLWLVIGGGALAVAAGAVLIVVLVVVRPGRPDLGWQDARFDP